MSGQRKGKWSFKPLVSGGKGRGGGPQRGGQGRGGGPPRGGGGQGRGGGPGRRR